MSALMEWKCDHCGGTRINFDELATLRAELAAAREALERIVGGDHPEGTSLAVNNNYRELEARLRAIARAALGGRT